MTACGHTRGSSNLPFSPFHTHPSATGKGQREERETATCNIEGDALLMALDSLIWTQKDNLRSYMKWFNWLMLTPGHPPWKTGTIRPHWSHDPLMVLRKDRQVPVKWRERAIKAKRRKEKEIIEQNMNVPSVGVPPVLLRGWLGRRRRRWARTKRTTGMKGRWLLLGWRPPASSASDPHACYLHLQETKGQSELCEHASSKSLRSEDTTVLRFLTR